MEDLISQGDVEIALRDALGRRGLSSRDINKLLVRSSFKKNGDEFFIISRKRIGFEWNRMTASNSNYEVKISAYASQRSLKQTTEKFAFETWVALMRHKEIGSKVDSEPAWSICANETTISLLNKLGLDMTTLNFFSNPSAGPVRQYVVTEKGYALGKTRKERRGSKQIGSSVVDYHNFGLTSGFLSVERIDITTPELTLCYTDGNNPAIEVKDCNLPESLMMGLVGKKLGDLVSDVFEETEAVIKDVKVKDKSTYILKIQDAKKHLEPYPGKIIPEWHREMLKVRR